MGRVKVNSGELGVISEGFVVGNRFRFKILRPDRILSGVRVPGEVLGIGDVVMDEGGTSFKGNVLGTATSGTFIGR